jgi:SAM-dependent methyltransferase
MIDVHSAEEPLATSAREAAWCARPCPLCFGTNVVELGVRVCDLPTRGGRFRFMHRDCVCAQCGFAFSRDVPDERFLEDYYAAGFLRVLPDDKVPFGFDVDFRLATLRAHLPQGARILEIGAGDGAFVGAMSRAGFGAYGIDLVDDGQCPRRGRQTTISCVAVDGRDVDSIVTYYLLEHIADPRSFLALCRSRLKVGGLIVIEVPNLETHPEEALHPEHFSYFTAGSLRALVEALGFKVLTHEKSGASRYFGQTLVARLEAPRCNAPVQPLAVDAVGRAVQGTRELMERAARSIAAREKATARLLAQIVLERGGPQSFELIAWGANQLATEIGRAALAAGVRDRAVVDRAPSKAGHLHDGYAGPIRPPLFAKTAPRHRVIVICSQAWQDHIRAEIEAMDLCDVSVYSAPAS